LNNDQCYHELYEWVESLFTNQPPDHDIYHICRVVKYSVEIAETVDCDTELVKFSALLHDITDHKLFACGSTNIKTMRKILSKHNVPQNFAHQVQYIITNTSYSKQKVEPAEPSTELKIVRDADRLDAIGAVGIARAFSYGALKQRPFYHPTDHTSTVHHFYDKLLLLKDGFYTKKAGELAEERHNFLETYLQHFENETNYGIILKNIQQRE